MPQDLRTLDWSLIQAFVTVAETGSLSAAARALDQSQPTLGRQIRRLEEATGLDLFHRQPRGLILTEQGEALLPAARRMAEGFGALALATAGMGDGLTGALRITASEIVAFHHLPPILSRIREAAPGLEIVLLPSDTTENLLFRDADIAVRMYRPDQQEIVTRRLGALAVGAYAAQDYLDRRGHPQTLADLAAHDVIGFDRSDLILRAMRDMGLEAEQGSFALRCDDQVTYWQMVRAGCGIGFGQQSIGDADPLVTRVLPDLDIPALPVWLAAHETLRRTPRVALAWEMLVQGLAPLLIR
ncbi:LysR family transcriptional regulator [Primorskyibacter flagellatus]|uniref:LysR family transcriptional regulator n=1 Tax=Primorskyibacter flagellatus TaxID=1387277 RepID=A0A917AAE3_9RHOB|nr:LysR family transcriptional regulator [Primorskyibacter flagellatus]GGE37095.1 LysR family transcriptional regulator [Primorskyibacter flagellatus]